MSRELRATATPGLTQSSTFDFGPNETACLILMNGFFVRYLLRLHAAFDGDLIEAIVLGEIAHHNVSGVTPSVRGPSPRGGRTPVGRVEPEALLPTNAFSIAAATGIPRETVRRKIASLKAKGWLRVDPPANLLIGPATRDHFVASNRVTAAELLTTAKELAELIARRPVTRTQDSRRSKAR